MSKILGFTLVLLFVGTTAFAQSPSCSKTCKSKKTSQVSTDGDQTKMMTTNAGTSKKSCAATAKSCTGKTTSHVSTDGDQTKMMTTNAGTSKKSCTMSAKECSKKTGMSEKDCKAACKKASKTSGSTSATFKNAGMSPGVSTVSHSSEKHGKKQCSMTTAECAKKMGMTEAECKAICGGKAGVKAQAEN